MKGELNNLVVLQNWFPQETRSILFNLEKFQKTEKSATKSSKWDEWRRIWVVQVFKIEIQKRGPNNSVVLQNWSPPPRSPKILGYIRMPLFNFRKFKKTDKIASASCRMDWNEMNGKEFGSCKFFKNGIQNGDQISQSFCRICSH